MTKAVLPPLFHPISIRNAEYGRDISPAYSKSRHGLVHGLKNEVEG
jgi:hypothetical protein